MPWTPVNGPNHITEIYASVYSHDVYATWDRVLPGFRHATEIGKYNLATNRFDRIGSGSGFRSVVVSAATVAVVTDDPTPLVKLYNPHSGQWATIGKKFPRIFGGALTHTDRVAFAPTHYEYPSLYACIDGVHVYAPRLALGHVDHAWERIADFNVLNLVEVQPDSSDPYPTTPWKLYALKENGTVARYVDGVWTDLGSQTYHQIIPAGSGVIGIDAGGGLHPIDGVSNSRTWSVAPTAYAPGSYYRVNSAWWFQDEVYYGNGYYLRPDGQLLVGRTVAWRPGWIGTQFELGTAHAIRVGALTEFDGSPAPELIKFTPGGSASVWSYPPLRILTTSTPAPRQGHPYTAIIECESDSAFVTWSLHTTVDGLSLTPEGTVAIVSGTPHMPISHSLIEIWVRDAYGTSAVMADEWP